MFLNAAGKTHDSSAFNLSPFARALEAGKLPERFWIVGDDAYALKRHLLCPFPGRGLGALKDTFNFYQSNCRIKIEQAFGILVRRWGVLWRALECAHDRAPLVFSVCCKLHNICMRCTGADGE